MIFYYSHCSSNYYAFFVIIIFLSNITTTYLSVFLDFDHQTVFSLMPNHRRFSTVLRVHVQHDRIVQYITAG